MDKARVPLDGTPVSGYVTLTERNWYMPSMFYAVVMDCDDEVQNLLGNNKYGRIQVRLEMTANDDHLSFEDQGSISTDAWLLFIFLALFLLSYRDL